MRFDDWQEMIIDDVCEVVDCLHKTAPTVEWSTKYRMLRTTNIRKGKIDIENTKSVDEETYNKWVRRGELEVGDVILTREAPMGEVGIIKEEKYKLFLGQRLLQLKPKEEIIDNHFLFYSLQGKELQHQIKMNEGTGSVVSNIRIPVLKKMKIYVPKLEIQENVVKSLKLIDEKIELNNSIISNLEQLAQTLFKHWFVDFEFPNEEGKPYKLSGGKMVESELGMIPEGWKVKQLNEVVKHSKESFNPNKEEQIQVAHFSLPAYDSKRYPIFEDSKTIKSNKYYINKSSVMFSKMNPKTPRTWLPNIQSKYINVCSSEYVVLDTSLYENKGYIFSVINSDDFNNYLINNATGSTNSRQRVRPEISLKYTFAYNEIIAKEFEQKVGSFYKKIINLREKIFTLSNLRDTLLPKLLSGEIELPDDLEVAEDV